MIKCQENEVKMKQEFHLNIEKALTASRLSAYKNNDENYEETLARYLYNIELCRALYSSLHFFEICLRNKIDEILSQLCNRNDWYTIIPLSDSAINKLEEVKKRISDGGKAITHERIVSELSLGFWTAFFSKRYSSCAFQSKIIKYGFKNCPKAQKNSANIQNIMEQIRNLRNRVYHYERICHWNDLQSKHDLILECIKWMQPSVFELVTKVDTFEHIYNHGEMQFLPIIKDNWN